MDYSTLNRLKDKLEQATSASQAASISAEIEKEERRIQEAEELEKRQKSAILSNIESLNSSTLSPRQRVESFIERGRIIMKEEYHHSQLMPDYISGPKTEQWFNEINIFNSRFLRNHSLHDQIADICKGHKHSFTPHEEMMGCLQALITDDEFWQEIEQKEKTVKKSSKEYDVFISHANADKEEYVNQLKSSLEKLRISIFYDKDTLEWGDNWKDKILEGVKKAEFAIIVISENFFGREWTEKELIEFLDRQNTSGQKIILPILHNITVDQLKEKYPAVADIQALNSVDYSCDEIALKFAGQLIKRLKS